MTRTIWAEPRELYEVVDGKPVEKNDMTAKHSKTQANGTAEQNTQRLVYSPKVFP